MAPVWEQDLAQGPELVLVQARGPEAVPAEEVLVLVLELVLAGVGVEVEEVEAGESRREAKVETLPSLTHRTSMPK